MRFRLLDITVYFGFYLSFLVGLFTCRLIFVNLLCRSFDLSYWWVLWWLILFVVVYCVTVIA